MTVTMCLNGFDGDYYARRNNPILHVNKLNSPMALTVRTVLRDGAAAPKTNPDTTYFRILNSYVLRGLEPCIPVAGISASRKKCGICVFTITNSTHAIHDVNSGQPQ